MHWNGEATLERLVFVEDSKVRVGYPGHQQTQELHYNRGTKVHSFGPGDRVLLLLPSMELKLLAKWQSPFEVCCHVGPVEYEIRSPNQRKKYAHTM